jgi:hypothetical protein
VKKEAEDMKATHAVRFPYRHKKSQGQSLTEYALLGFILFSFSLLGFTHISQAFRQQLSLMLAGFTAPSNGGGALNSPFVVSTVSPLDVPLEQDTLNSLISASLPSTSSTPLAIKNIVNSSNATNLIEVTGGNAVTNQLASLFLQIAKEAKDTNNLTPEEANALMGLANKGFELAKAQEKLDALVKNPTTTIQQLNETTFEMNGKTYTTQQLADSMSVVLTSEQLKTMNQLLVQHNTGNSRPLIADFLDQYKIVNASTAMKDPAIKKVVDEASLTISKISNAYGSFLNSHLDYAVSYGDKDKLVEESAGPGSLNNALIRIAGEQNTADHSGTICTTGNGTVNSKNCS